MKKLMLVLASVVLANSLAWAQSREATVRVNFSERLGPLEIEKTSLGQGGISEEPMWADRISEVRALRPRLIRLFIQEYFDLLPAGGRYHFETLDRCVDAILKAGAKPLMNISFKPRLLFPAIDQSQAEPNDYQAWESLVENLVKHYRDRGAGIQFWEVANEPDIGEAGGCPYLFRPESYVRFYRRTVAAILRADAEARVGGPALADPSSPILPALLDACAREKLPLHFVSWHAYRGTPQEIRWTVTLVKDLLKKYPSLRPETVLNEWNMVLRSPSHDPRLQPCFVLETIWEMKEAGLDWSCYYHIRDYPVEERIFGKFISPDGTAYLVRKCNRAEQYLGLFDFQNNIRPCYFAFKLLSRLSGQRLKLVASDPLVHGFSTHDGHLHAENLLLWNYSAAPVEVEVSLENLAKDMDMHPLTLDAQAPSNDECARLRIEPMTQLKEGNHRLKIHFDPYAIKSWWFE